MWNDNNPFKSVYGPVQSWRFGKSLGIDPIGPTSTCSFDCVYCQLGDIESQTMKRRIFIPTERVREDLEQFSPYRVDIVTFSGSGEPTLAENLGELLIMTKMITAKPVAVLTNGTLLSDHTVRCQLEQADVVSVKVDSILSDALQRINRPLADFNMGRFWAGLWQFRQQYRGNLSVQTMLLSPWSEEQQAYYMAMMQQLGPDEIQLNTPTRPKPVRHEIDARGNHSLNDRPYETRTLKPVSSEVLREFSRRIQRELGIRACYPQELVTQ